MSWLKFILRYGKAGIILKGHKINKTPIPFAGGLQELDLQGELDRYFEPSLSEEELKIAGLQGWILGVDGG